ncbi:MAG: hypothetical protein K0S28_984 [Paucimonas sp.]|nr:hypothetical protein [Paucimonas sp.]
MLCLSFCAQAGATPASDSWNQWLSRNTAPVSDDSARTDFADLASFGEAIKGTKIVLLDEQSHGEENVFALKARLVRYLHQVHGFEVLVFESGLYDMDRIWRTADASNSIMFQAPGNLFFLYAGSPAIRELLGYVQSHKSGPTPLILTGMDSQHSGRYSNEFLLADLAQRLEASGNKIRKDGFWADFSSLTRDLFSMKRTAPEARVRFAYFNFIGKLQNELSERKDPFWYRILVSIEDQARRQWGLKHEQRSAVMGENLATLIRHRYPGKKIVVWGQFVHLNRAGLPAGGNVGHAVAQEFGQQAYAVHFTGNKGTYYHFFNAQNTPVISFPSKNIESLLEQQPGPYNFTNWRKLPEHLKTDTTMQASLFHYLPDGLLDLPGPNYIWQKRIDGTFYLDRITSIKP